MAVFTTFSREALERYVVMFGLGELESFEPIESGIENSNYYVTLDSGAEFVLTITEDLGFDEVPFFNDLLAQLERSGLPVPNPTRTLDGMASTVFCGKPAWLFPRLPGSHLHSPAIEHCRTVGNALARLHEGARSAKYTRDNPYDDEWVTATLSQKSGQLSAADQKILVAIHEAYRSVDSGLPRGIIHGDLFRDNVLFEGDALTGIIDFYHSCEDILAQDIAITINDWCTMPDGATDDARMEALLDGYEQHRALTDQERRAMPLLRKYGAMRFVLTRLLSGDVSPVAGKDGGYMKDPEEFLRIVRKLAS